jgi:DNA-directed RNA polymerase specialized sigma24 family protein
MKGEKRVPVMAEHARPDLPEPDSDPTKEPGEKVEPECLNWGSESDRLEEAARRIRAKANRYAAQHLGDGLQGEEILDDVLQSAIAAGSRSRIEKPEGYLFRGVVRRVWDLLSHRPVVEYAGSGPELDAVTSTRSGPSVHEIERNLLVKEIIALMEEETRMIHFRRARGDRWNSIAAELGISEAAAQERFRYGMEKVRARVLGSDLAKDTGSGKGRSKP